MKNRALVNYRHRKKGQQTWTKCKATLAVGNESVIELLDAIKKRYPKDHEVEVVEFEWNKTG